MTIDTRQNSVELEKINQRLEAEAQERRRTEAIMRNSNEVLEQLATERPLSQMLHILTGATEKDHPELTASVLLLDKEKKHLHYGASNNLPEFFTQAIDGLEVGEGQGACGTAVHRRERVVIENVFTHPFMAAFTPLLKRAGIGACWSQPIFSPCGDILGTFALYYAFPAVPKPDEIELVQQKTYLAGIVIDRKRNEARLEAYRDQLRCLASELSLAEERERRRIASHLHDHIGQALAACKMQLGRLEEDHPQLAGSDALNLIRTSLESTLKETRSLTLDLSPPILYEIGFEAAVKWLANRLQREYGVRFDVRDKGQFEDLPEETAITLFQLVRELMINVGKHAGVEEAQIQLVRDDEKLAVRVIDRGVGFALERLEDYGEEGMEGFGLFSVRERVALLGGTFKIESRLGQGSRLEIEISL